MNFGSSNLLVLTHHRTNIPLVARLFREGGGSYTALLRELEVSRGSMSRSLAALAEPGWVTRERSNPKIYILSRSGAILGPPSAEILDWSMEARCQEVALKRWTLPIAAALQGWSLRFGELRALLPGITPRALTLALKEMQAAGLLERALIEGFPPSASYRLTQQGQGILPSLGLIL